MIHLLKIFFLLYAPILLAEDGPPNSIFILSDDIAQHRSATDSVGWGINSNINIEHQAAHTAE